MTSLKLTVQVKSGMISFGRDTLYDFFRKCKDGYYEVSIAKEKKSRSNNQNRYYWGAVIPIVRQGLLDLGIRMTSEETHDLLKYKFLLVEHITKDGEIVRGLGKTSDLTTSEFMDYLAAIQEWAVEFLSVQIPDPNEQVRLM